MRGEALPKPGFGLGVMQRDNQAQPYSNTVTECHTVVLRPAYSVHIGCEFNSGKFPANVTKACAAQR
jgi:hypothetical protein